ncbi:MAG: tRNA lysidine(34) synthetase TilS [Firmicutes bacterium]|nr:tRNA lysidine(34) synthetase TilS [Bacillota bacterium]
MNIKCRLAIEKYSMLSHGDSIIVGLSGGADSCAMLHFLCSLRDEFALKITAVHVNHMIRGAEAERDAQAAEKFCKKLGVKFVLYERDIPAIAASNGKGLEECGRSVRYEIFEQEAAKCGGKIATAHTLSDSAETMLFHMIRGCSLSGLKGIPPVRGNIIRPLILCERGEIEAYCSEHNIEYMTDSTNLSSDYARNKIRLQIIPIMREMNPSILSAMSRLSECAAEDEDYIQKEAEIVAAEYMSECKANMIYKVHSAVARRALVIICRERLGIIPEYRHISAMLQCIEQGSGSVNLTGDNVISFTGNSIAFCKKTYKLKMPAADKLWQSSIYDKNIITPFGQKVIIKVIDRKNYEDICKIYKNVFQNSLDCDTIENTSIFRFRNDGDFFSQAGRGNTKSLKKLFNEKKIPLEERARTLLLESGGKLAWICGIGPAEGCQVTDSTEKVIYIEVM